MIEQKNILISGGKGFIGSALVDSLRYKNKVHVIDNMLHAPNQKELSGVIYINSSCDDILKLKFKNIQFDYFFHLGEYSRVETSFSEIKLVFENSTRQLINVLEFCNTNKCKLIYSASSTKFTDDNIGADLSPYAFFKAKNVEIINQYANWTGIDYAICYFYNVFGPGESSDDHFGTVIAKFLDLYSKGHSKLPVNLPGTQRRNFTHIADTIEALMLVALRGQGDGFGIASQENYSIIELCEMLNCEPQYYPEKKGNRSTSKLEIEKTIKLGWSPKHSLREYILGHLIK